MAVRLHELELDYESIVALCSIEDWPWLRSAYQDRLPYQNPEQLAGRPFVGQPTPSSLYFVLGELPFVTELYERRRQEARADTHLSVDGIKELLLAARSHWQANEEGDKLGANNWITPSFLRGYLQYVRNLALMDRRFTPDLYTLVVAAKQMAGDEFALILLESAKRYSFQNPDWTVENLASMTVGIGEMEFPDGGITKAKNRLEGQPLLWRSLSLKPVPPKPKKRAWAYQWNPFRQCSWPPEDNRIEAFTAHVRHQAKSLLGTDLARIEQFTSSMMDGIDLRETLKHCHQPVRVKARDIYVKDIPRARGNVEVIVFLFEVPADPQKFSWRATWYAEHDQESTLCFFATPFLEDMIGPGIAQSRYGGALFLFPPRGIPNIWEDPQFNFTETLEERLLAGACAHTQESHVALVSPMPPISQWRRIAQKYGRKLIPIPLKRFSGQVVDRLRRFHVLNGHEIRSYARKFIRE